MSFAVHVFMREKFSKERYQHFLAQAQNLYGQWDLANPAPAELPANIESHGCWIRSKDLPGSESVRVEIVARQMTPDIPWGFAYEWGLHLETGAGRSALSLAVQLGALILATQTFEWLAVIDRDSCVRNDPAEFRSKQAVVDHVRRVIEEEFSALSECLKRRDIIDGNGYLRVNN